MLGQIGNLGNVVAFDEEEAADLLGFVDAFAIGHGGDAVGRPPFCEEVGRISFAIEDNDEAMEVGIRCQRLCGGLIGDVLQEIGKWIG